MCANPVISITDGGCSVLLGNAVIVTVVQTARVGTSRKHLLALRCHKIHFPVGTPKARNILKGSSKHSGRICLRCQSMSGKFLNALTQVSITNLAKP